MKHHRELGLLNDMASKKKFFAIQLSIICANQCRDDNTFASLAEDMPHALTGYAASVAYTSAWRNNELDPKTRQGLVSAIQDFETYTQQAVKRKAQRRRGA